MKKYYMVLDTETAGTVQYPIAYNIGWMVCDKKGNELETRSFLIKELWIDRKHLVEECFYKNKLPEYKKQLKKGEISILPLKDIMSLMDKDIEKYHCKIGAYNMAFDKRAMTNVLNICNLPNRHFKNEKNLFCIMNLAEQVLMNRPTYFQFCEKYGLFTEKGNLKTSAESCYKYIAYNPYFIESHMAFEDVRIEKDIFIHILRQKKKMNWTKFGSVWAKVKKAYKEYKRKD